MANNNQRTTNVTDASRMDMVKNILPTAYNIAGLAPTGSVFKLNQDQLKKEILTVAKTFIPEFTDCTLEFNNKNGIIYAYVWLLSDSKHLRDSSPMEGNSAIRKPIYRFSKEIKEFMGKFCRKGNERTFSDDRGPGKVAIEVEIIRFMQIIFDTDGSQYSKTFSARRMRTEIALTANFRKGSNGRMGAFTFLQIEKRLQSEVSQMEPKPKRSYNI